MSRTFALAAFQLAFPLVDVAITRGLSRFVGRAREMEILEAALAKLAQDHRNTPIIGRSNLQQATPITFGYKMASILAGIDRHREHLVFLHEARGDGRGDHRRGS